MKNNQSEINSIDNAFFYTDCINPYKRSMFRRTRFVYSIGYW